MNIKIISGMMIMALSSLSQAQSNVQNNFEASANIESFCRVQTRDINFGVVSLPLTGQSANSQINVLCSNATPYKVDLEYGGNYIGISENGSLGTPGITYTLNYQNNEGYDGHSGYRLYKDGKPISTGQSSQGYTHESIKLNLNGDNNFGDFSCISTQPNTIYFRSQEAAKLIQNTSIINSNIPDIHGLCNIANGSLNINKFKRLFGDNVANKGVMTGTFKGDKLAYQITLPSDNSKPWIAGVNRYEAIGIGSNQVIEMNAKLVPASSSSSYLAADTYLDTIVATISY